MAVSSCFGSNATWGRRVATRTLSEGSPTSTFEWAWLLDDDSVPAPEALEQILSCAQPDVVQLSAMIDRDTGRRDDTHGWCGVLIPRHVVQTAGVPREDFFWWAEDTEYLQWRVPCAGFQTVRCERSVVEVSRTRADGSKPPWKYYYEARNQVYFRLHVQHQIPDCAFAHLRPHVRAGRAARAGVRSGGARPVARAIGSGEAALDGRARCRRRSASPPRQDGHPG